MKRKKDSINVPKKVRKELRRHVSRHCVEQVEGNQHEDPAGEQRVSRVSMEEDEKNAPLDGPQSDKVLERNVVRFVEHQVPPYDRQSGKERPYDADGEAKLDMALE